MTKRINLIIGSTRQGRVGKQIADWLVTQASNEGINLGVLDLKEISLPNFDAAVPPAYMPTQTEVGKKWQSTIATSDAFVFLTPEYNRSIPGSLKNAIDYLFQEWSEKPASIVSYGYVDGGSSATKHLTDILDWVKVRVIGDPIAIPLTQQTFDETGAFKDIENSLGDFRETFLDSLKALSHDKEAVSAQ